MGIPGLQHLRVLRAALRSTAAGRAYDQRHLRLPTEHVAHFGGAVDDLVGGQYAEVDGHDLDDGA